MYRKTHLVPYGEYIPWKPLVGWISALDQIAYELTPGERLHTLDAPGLPTFGGSHLLREQLPPARPRARAVGRAVPRRAHEQRVLRRHGRVRAASPDVTDPRHRGRPVGGARRRVRDQRVRRSERTHCHTRRSSSSPRSSEDHPRIDRANARTCDGATGSPSSRSRWSSGWRRFREAVAQRAPRTGAARPRHTNTGHPPDLRRGEDDPRCRRWRPDASRRRGARRGRLIAGRDGGDRPGADGGGAPAPARRAPGPIRARERLPGGVRPGARGGLRPDRRDGLRPLARSRRARLAARCGSRPLLTWWWAAATCRVAR